MARQRRIDIAGAFYHVLTRGLNGMAIFRDERDRREFLKRLSEILEKTGCICYGWSLMTNHIHLLLRPTKTSLSEPLRRLLAGYASKFNQRYKRRGYLYQNRFKSILCQEDSYFLELIRYIHLNPVRAGIIKSIDELNKYPWTGHSTLCGKEKYYFQATKDVLSRFSAKRNEAIRKYQEFIKAGWNEGKRDDYAGGGLRRSAGGWEGVLALKKTKERWRGDEQILGDGDFVNTMLKKAKEQMQKRDEARRSQWTIDKLATTVCQLMSIDKKLLKRKGRMNKLSYTKAVIAYWGHRELGFSCAELGRYLGISKQGVSLAMRAGEVYVAKNQLTLTT